MRHEQRIPETWRQCSSCLFGRLRLVLGMSNRAKGGADWLYFDFITRVLTVSCWYYCDYGTINTVVLLCPAIIVHGAVHGGFVLLAVFLLIRCSSMVNVSCSCLRQYPHDLYCCAHGSYVTTTPTGHDGIWQRAAWLDGRVASDIWQKKRLKEEQQKELQGDVKMAEGDLIARVRKVLSCTSYMLRSVALFCFSTARNAAGSVLRDSRLCSWTDELRSTKKKRWVLSQALLCALKMLPGSVTVLKTASRTGVLWHPDLFVGNEVVFVVFRKCADHDRMKKLLITIIWYDTAELCSAALGNQAIDIKRRWK